MHLSAGKLPAELLDRLLGKYVAPDPSVIVGPGVGRDVAILDAGENYLVVKTDPVTYASEEIGWYAVHVNANDVACSGALPRWFLATVLLPGQGTTEQRVESIFGQIQLACHELNIAWCGGHTEIVGHLSQPIVVGQMIGQTAGHRYLTSGGARKGDAIILTKGIAVEGTAILAREKREDLLTMLSELDIQRGAELLRKPGISVVKDALIALAAGDVHAFHDVTEGGLATGLWELAAASHVGLVIEESKVPVLPECAMMCRSLGLDPLGLIASGALLIAAKPAGAQNIVDQLEAAGIRAAMIGEAVDAGQQCLVRCGHAVRSLPQFARDEITRLFE
jgi:hydrogenase maturation factor